MLIEYLSRYVNRVAISKSRLKYVKGKEKVESIVEIEYKDYRKQKEGEAAANSIKEMERLIAIHKFMQHVLPPYFLRVRYTGLHAWQTFKKYEEKMSASLLRDKAVIKEMFRELKRQSGRDGYKCKECGCEEFDIVDVLPNKSWKFQFITLPTYKQRGPPKKVRRSIKEEIQF